MPAKRPHPETERDQESSKKMKIHLNLNILALSRDEISAIMAFLEVGEVLMLSLTCKSLYESVESIAKILQPFVVQESWSIANALNAHSEFIISSSHEAQKLVALLCEHKDTFQIPSKLSFSSPYGADVLVGDMLSVVAQKIATDDKKQLPVVKVDWTDDSIKTSMHDGDPDYDHKFEKKVEEVSLTSGSGIKHLEISNDKCSRMDTYRILSHCPNLESLELFVTEDGMYTLKKLKRTVKTPSNLPWNKKKYPGFTLLQLPKSDTMKSVVSNAGLVYENGKGYYQLVKKETVTNNKKIVAIDTSTGQLTSGDAVFALLNLKKIAKFDLTPGVVDGVEIFVQSTSHNRKLSENSYVLYETGNYNDGGEEEEDDFSSSNGITIPVLSNLKKLAILSCYDYDAGMQFIIDLLQLAPNLESLEYVYHNEADDRLLKFISNQCPHLKELLIRGDDGATPMENLFTDEGIIRFLDNVPSLTSLILYHCAEVSGEVFTKIGRYSQLKTLCIERVAMNGSLVNQYDNVHFGGGVLESLELLALDGIYEDLPDNFVDSVIETAPNLKRVYCGPGSSVDISQIYQKCSKLIHMDLNDREEKLATILESLVSSNHIRKLSVSAERITVELLKRCNWSNLKKLSLNGDLPDEPDQWLSALVKACPNLTVLILPEHHYQRNSAQRVKRTEAFRKALLEVLSDPNTWPELTYVTPIPSTNQEDLGMSLKLAALRPLIVIDETLQLPQSKILFVNGYKDVQSTKAMLCIAEHKQRHQRRKKSGNK